MRINLFKAAVVLLICLAALTACVPYHPMKITVEELPSNTDIYVLLKPDPEYLKERSDDDPMKDTEIWGYSEEGWVSASLAVQDVYERRSETSVYELEVAYKRATSSDEIIEFCKLFREMRFAAVDKSGNVQQVSQTFSLVPDNKQGYPCALTYDVKSDTIEITNYCGTEVFRYMPLGWWMLVTVFSWAADIAAFVLLVISLAKQRSSFTRGVRIALSLLSIPAIAGIIMAAVCVKKTYPDVENAHLIWYDAGGIALFNLPFIAVILLFAISVFVHRLKRKKGN